MGGEGVEMNRWLRCTTYKNCMFSLPMFFWGVRGLCGGVACMSTASDENPEGSRCPDVTVRKDVRGHALFLSVSRLRVLPHA